jgi:hypothetical protein
MTKTRMFTATLVFADGLTTMVLVPFDEDGEVPRIVEVGAAPMRRRFRRVRAKGEEGGYRFVEMRRRKT